ncbi:MAG: T9SS type A sorting domain-containing protein [Bacteroidetes bacterium]|nr:T9SS type A sorting domain-containing protein [Bacteroidota bacterium]
MKRITFILTMLLAFAFTRMNAQGTWTRKADFINGRSGAIGLSIGNYGYAGTGGSSLGWQKDFWRYDPNNNSWTQMADFPGSARGNATAFSIEDKGYLGVGQDDNGFRKDFWQYDPVTNSWNQRSDFGGGERCVVVGFSIGSKGYIGTGLDNNWNRKKDFWEYNAQNDSWIPKANFPGAARAYAAGFATEGRGYIGNGDTYSNDFWEYNPESNSWVQKASYPGGGRTNMVGFSVGNDGYLGTGYNGPKYRDFWKYNPQINTWEKVADFGGEAREWAIGFAVGGKGYLGLGIPDNYSSFNDFWEYTPEAVATDSWTQVADFSGIARAVAVAFSLGEKGYVGTGMDGSTIMKDFWEFNPATQVWSQKADVGGEPRSYAIGITINDKGYIGTGLKPDGTYAEDFWEYDPITNAWTEKAPFLGGPRSGPVAFSIGSKAYVGTGESGGIGGGRTKDMWEYDQASDTWTRKADFGGSAIKNPTGFSIGSKGYLVAGNTNQGFRKETWEYDPASDTWTKRADFGGTARAMAVGFSIGDKGYVGTGDNGGTNFRDFWEYDPLTNTWQQKADYGGGEIGWAVGFVINDEGYLGTGYTWGVGYRNIYWKYTPGTTSSCTSPAGLTSAKITSSSAKLDWDGVNGAAGYGVRYKIVGDKEWTLKTATTSARKIEGLQPGTDYVWSVRTYCSFTPPAVTSAWSPNQSFFTAALRLEAPVSTSLDVYPNPFQQSATITYSTANDARMQIALYDISGKLMKILVNANVSSGMHTLSLSSEGLSQGIYLLKFQVNDELIIRKVVIE